MRLYIFPLSGIEERIHCARDLWRKSIPSGSSLFHHHCQLAKFVFSKKNPLHMREPVNCISFKCWSTSNSLCPFLVIRASHMDLYVATRTKINLLHSSPRNDASNDTTVKAMQICRFKLIYFENFIPKKCQVSNAVSEPEKISKGNVLYLEIYEF